MLNMFLANLRMMLRNKQAFFWSLMFPLMFTSIFGLFFGKQTNSNGQISLINNSKTELAINFETSLRDSKLFTIKNETSIDNAKKEIKKNTISAAVYVPEGFGLVDPEAPKQITIYTDPGSAQAASMLQGYIGQFLNQTNFQIQNAKPIYTLNQESVTTNELTYFDFVMAGILGMALMNSSIIGVGVGMSKYREDKILKRITTTPLKTWKFIVAEVISRLILNLVQIALILGVGIYLFNGHVYGNLAVVLLMALVGGILFQLVGFVVASFSKTTQAAEGMATAITIPMMFLSGVFFPIDSLPKWLVSIVQYLPLAPLLRILRNVTLEAGSVFDNPNNIIIVASWILACLLISMYKFRLTEE